MKIVIEQINGINPITDLETKEVDAIRIETGHGEFVLSEIDGFLHMICRNGCPVVFPDESPHGPGLFFEERKL